MGRSQMVTALAGPESDPAVTIARPPGVNARERVKRENGACETAARSGTLVVSAVPTKMMVRHLERPICSGSERISGRDGEQLEEIMRS